MANTCTIMGIPFVVQPREAVAATVREWLSTSVATPHVVVTPNPEFCVRAAVQPDFRKVLQRADLRLPDGTGLVLAARVLWHVPLRRLTGVDFMMDVCRVARETSSPIFFLGAAPGVAARTAAVCQQLFPGLRVAGAESGDGSDSPGGLHGAGERVKASSPAIVVVAFGAPRQEQWIEQNRSAWPSVRLFIGVGGAFDYVSGGVRRAPVWWRRLGLEWAYRLLRQPGRLPRILVAIVLFPLFALVDRLVQLPQGRKVGYTRVDDH